MKIYYSATIARDWVREGIKKGGRRLDGSHIRPGFWDN